MTLLLHDTAARAVREFQPVTPGRVSLYLCGATVQAVPHIGHLRSVVCFDILVRWLAASGYSVTYCRNVTDIDDKILRAAGAEGIPWWAIAERNQRAFSRAYDALGCRPPDVEPRATGHIPEMIALIRRLIDGGHAYNAGGDVYFDVHSVDGYGALSGQRLHAAVRDGNYALASGNSSSVADCLAQVRSMLAVLGLDPLNPLWSANDSSDRLFGAVDGLVRLALRQREAARARGDYASADSIRDTMEKIGVVVQDTPEGPRWELKR